MKVACKFLHSIQAFVFVSALFSGCSNLVDSNNEQFSDSKSNRAVDWSVISQIGSSNSESAIKISYDENYVYFRIDELKNIEKFNIFINADGDSNTGYQASNYWSKSGADFLISGGSQFNGSLYKSRSAGWDWDFIAGDFSCVYENKVIDLKIAFSTLNLTSSDIDKLSIAYVSYLSGWQNEGTVLPMNGSPFACVHQKFDLTKGIIIPAYISLTDKNNWDVLAYGANLLTSNKNSTNKDYFVVVNSEKNGPFTNDSDWKLAAEKYDSIRNNGGRIFGYVHTCEEPIGPLYRDIKTVEAEIKAWVDGYPQLDGIWLDEFYPRFEIAGSCDANPTYPNGKEFAPTDTSKFDNNGTMIYYDVDPTGGYYDQLCSWIRQTYPTLRIIGNAGGDLYSNQLEYGKLVDILVAFEQNYENASANNWAGLNSPNQGHASNKLALIHGNSVDLIGAINASFKSGFSHVYITDRKYGYSGELNVWGGLTSYLYTEIEELGKF